MKDADKKDLLVVVRHTPYGSSLGRAALDTALAAAAFDQKVHLLFLGDGVLQLLPQQDAAAVGLRNIARLLASLPLYDIESVLVDESSAQRYGLDLHASPVPARAIDSAAVRKLMANCHHTVGF
jgi:tRNA 2-thiouridine synthesizing protein C